MSSTLFKELSLKGFLSYGPDATVLALAPLNVFIGANGSGKSNLVEALSVLRAVPKDLPLPIRQGGGVKDWLWKGSVQSESAEIEVVLSEGKVARSSTGEPSVRYRLEFGAEGGSFTVLDERLENEFAAPGESKPYFYFGYENGRPMINVQEVYRELRRADIDATQSILSQRRDPDSYPEITRLAELLGKTLIYRDWSFGPNAPIRQSCRVDSRSDALSESLDNLPCRLAVLKREPPVKKALLEKLSELAPGFDDIEVIPEGGRLQLYLMEGSNAVPAHRLSDGTLRYLALLAILLDPSPAPLIVIEEPELGLHFDVMPKLAGLLRDAAVRTQLVVTTHSDPLVDALSNTPESVVVCGKVGASTTLQRLEREKLGEWLKTFSLGSLWTRGQIGGTRW